MSGVVTAVAVGSLAIGAYGASKSASAAKSAARTAGSAEERISAENRYALQQASDQAAAKLSPWTEQEKAARFRYENELMTTNRYVPGRDDIQPLESGRSAYLDFAEYAPGQYAMPGDAPGATPTPAGPSGTGRITPEWERQATREGLADQPDVLARYNAVYAREDGGVAGGVAPGGRSPYLSADLRSEDVYGGVMSDVGAVAPGGDAYRGRTPEYGYEQYIDADRIDPTQYMEDLSSGYSAFIDNPIYQQMIESGSEAALASAASQGIARGGTAIKAIRDVGQGVSSQFFSNYLNTMGDITGINEARRMNEAAYDESRYGAARDINQQRFMGDLASDESRYANYLNIGEGRRTDALNINEQRLRDAQNINEQRFTNIINLDEQRDVRSQNIQEQRYSNYMNMLQSMAQPTSTTNVANIGMGTAGNIANIGAQSVASQNQYNLGAVAASNAARADVAGGITNLASAYIGSQGRPQTQTPYMPQTSGTIWGGANAPKPTSYAGYA